MQHHSEAFGLAVLKQSNTAKPPAPILRRDKALVLTNTKKDTGRPNLDLFPQAMQIFKIDDNAVLITALTSNA